MFLAVDVYRDIATISQGTVLDNASVKVQARSTLSKGEGYNYT